MTMDEQDRRDEDAALRDRLDAYAEARLRPDPAAMARVRASLVREFRARDAAGARVAAPPRRGWLAALAGRPALIAGTGLLVVALAAGGAVASEPGGPLYPVRLWIQTLTLPADPAARADAELIRMQDRLDEATAAVNAGNAGAVSAALEAYRQAATDALAAAGGDPDRAARLALELGRHQAVLEALVARLPAQASEAVRLSLERTEARILELLEETPGASRGPARSPGSAGATPSARPTPAADRSAKPQHTPPGRPETTPKPKKSPPDKPEKSPRPGG